MSQKPPLYVAIGWRQGLALCLDIDPEVHARIKASSIKAMQHRYWRTAGAWNIGYGWKDGVLVAKASRKEVRHLNNTPLVEVTEEYWMEDNDMK